VLMACAWDLGAMLATGSRGALVGLAVGGLLVFGRLISRRPGLAIALPVVVMSGLVIFFSLTSQMVFENLVERLVSVAEAGEQGNFLLRLVMWGAGYQMITSSHWMGIGINSYEMAMNQYADLEILRLTHPHSFYLYILIELGVIGLSIFGFLVFFIVRQLKDAMRQIASVREKDALFSLSAGLLAFSVHGLIDFTIHDPQIWLYLGTTIAASRVLVDSQGQEE
jgi:O-antigen ligase